MADSPEECRLIERARFLRQGLCYLLGFAVLFGLFLIFLIEPETDLRDVQVPVQGRYLIEKFAGMLASGEPWIVGKGAGRAPQALAMLNEYLSLIIAGVVIWGLVKRHHHAVWVGAAYLIATWMAGPIPTAMQPTPPIAVSSDTARKMLAREPDDGESRGPWRRYMTAQIAYLEGDRPRAAALARGIDGHDLESPIAASFRLQFLRGEPLRITSVCFKAGCLSSAALEALRVLCTLMTAIACLLALPLFLLLRIISQRLSRIAALRSSAQRLQSGT